MDAQFACLDSAETRQVQSRGTRHRPASSTPTVYVNGRMVNGRAAVEVFTGIIDDELSRAILRDQEKDHFFSQP